jgi:XTP/dITP diphosphohydrolase
LFPPPWPLLATANPGKLRELRELLAGLDLELRGLADYPGAPIAAEDADTYLANARAKAAALAAHSGLPALADDSGLEVDALGGRPGVRSARFADDAGKPGSGDTDADNRSLLLERLRDVPEPARGARFRCVIAVVRPEGRELSAEGVCEGVIATAPRGSGGFGYDPLFFYPALARTFAELSQAEKQRVSHRANAIAALRDNLLGFLRG